VEEVEVLVVDILDQVLLEVQELLLSEHRDQQDLQQAQVQTQLQHYRHQLEVVKLRHSRFLETLQLANYLLFTNPIEINI
jgi:hypothetical protein